MITIERPEAPDRPSYRRAVTPCTAPTGEEPSKEVGNRTISAWAVAPDAVWIQVRSPDLARRVSRLNGAREVAQSHASGYLRTFEVQRDFDWARTYVEQAIIENN